MRRILLLALLLPVLAPPARAQNSAYGILGAGFPARPVSFRARALGDGGASVDPQSALNPAALAMVTTITVSTGVAQEFRTLTLQGVETGGLHQVRFPHAMMTGRFSGKRLSYSLGYFSYAERTFDLSSEDTVLLRGVPVVETDRDGSAGGIVDLRGGLAWSMSPRWAVGLGAHILSGSARLTQRKSFSDSTYRSFVQTSDAEFTGYGVSVGLLATPSPAFRAGLSARLDSKLNRQIHAGPSSDISLPASVAAGLEARLAPAVRFAANTTWRSWSRASDGVAAGTTAFNTIEAGAGFELGGTPRTLPFPLRLGVRYATLPFSATAAQPHEIDLTGGTRVQFARNRARFDVTVERALRDGGGISERAWHVSVGFELIP